MQQRLEQVNGSLRIPRVHSLSASVDMSAAGDPQTDALLRLLELPHRWTVPYAASSSASSSSVFTHTAVTSSINNNMPMSQSADVPLPPPPVTAHAQDANEISLDDI